MTKQSTFKREAAWLVVLSAGVPAVAILLATAWPAIARWLSAR